MEAKQTISSKSLLPVIASDKNNSGAEFTLVSKTTGKDFTFKIDRKAFNGRMFTFVKVEKNYLEFYYLGSYYNGSLWNKKTKVESLSAKAISWVLSNVEKQKFEMLDNNVEILHLGKCLRCGRTLTDQESIQIGLGPVCRNL